MESVKKEAKLFLRPEMKRESASIFDRTPLVQGKYKNSLVRTGNQQRHSITVCQSLRDTYESVQMPIFDFDPIILGL